MCIRCESGISRRGLMAALAQGLWLEHLTGSDGLSRDELSMHALLGLRALYFALATFMGFVLPASVSPWAVMALQILTGFEARNLQRWSLERQGFRLMGVVQGQNEDGAVLNLADRRADLARGLT